MCAALTNDDAFDVCPTGGTGFSGSIIHSKIVLEFTTAIDPIKGGPIAANPFLQDIPNGLVQGFRLLEGNGIGGREWMQLGEVQRLIGVNVAETGQERLIKQQRFELAMSTTQGGVEPLWGKSFAQGFRSEFAEYFFRICR
jgi:hypothetical protein